MEQEEQRTRSQNDQKIRTVVMRTREPEDQRTMPRGHEDQRTRRNGTRRGPGDKKTRNYEKIRTVVMNTREPED
jgi:hypothetical protein